MKTWKIIGLVLGITVVLSLAMTGNAIRASVRQYIVPENVFPPGSYGWNTGGYIPYGGWTWDGDDYYGDGGRHDGGGGRHDGGGGNRPRPGPGPRPDNGGGGNRPRPGPGPGPRPDNGGGGNRPRPGPTPGPTPDNGGGGGGNRPRPRPRPTPTPTPTPDNGGGGNNPTPTPVPDNGGGGNRPRPRPGPRPTPYPDNGGGGNTNCNQKGAHFCNLPNYSQFYPAINFNQNIRDSKVDELYPQFSKYNFQDDPCANKTYYRSCICYDDGSCSTEENTNWCQACNQENVVSIREGYMCRNSC